MLVDYPRETLERELDVASYFISSSNFEKFVNKLTSDADVFAPVIINDRPRLKKIDASNITSIDLGSYRTSDPIKSVFLKAREDVSSYFNGDKNVPTSSKSKVIFCKSCDIAALAFEDRFFLGEIIDPFYAKERNDVIVIGSDCGDVIATCHCSILGVKPYPERDFDINLSVVADGYLVDVGSDKGKKLIDGNNLLFVDPTTSQKDQQIMKRQDMLDKVNDINKKYTYKLSLDEIVKRGLESEAWRGIAKSCTECGGCNISCPTCTCFLLYDEKSGSDNVRSRQWDSCMKAGYAKVAGGANTRPMLFRRTQNRWQCKFDYMFDKYGTYACSGCGRCTEVCMAKIDLREALLDLEKKLALSVKLE